VYTHTHELKEGKRRQAGEDGIGFCRAKNKRKEMDNLMRGFEGPNRQ
jgi:hypothetical protein